MADIGTPSRHGNDPLSSPSPPALSKLPQTSLSFPLYSQFPFELRQEVIRIAVDDAVDDVQSIWTDSTRRPRQPRQHPPRRPSQLARVSKEWQEQAEKQTFRSLSLTDEHSELAAFSTIVTGPRRRYVREIELEVCGEWSVSVEERALRAINGAGDALWGFEAITRLLQELISWETNKLLTLKLDIHLQEFSLSKLEADLADLPVMPFIETLHIDMMIPKRSNQLPLALLQVLGKVPQLTAVNLRLSPWECLNVVDKNTRNQELLDGLHSLTPHLRQLELSLPFVYRTPQQPGWLPGIRDMLPGQIVSCIRHLSYRLKVLVLDDHIDLSLFFKDFHDEDGDGRLATHSSWPDLEALRLRGPEMTRKNLMPEPQNDWFLQVLGRAARYMPKLQNLVVDVISQQPYKNPGNTQMFIVFSPESYLGLCKGSADFCLSVLGHTPSPSAVSVWKEAVWHTKLVQPAIEFSPADYLDEHGALVSPERQVWEEQQAMDAFQDS